MFGQFIVPGELPGLAGVDGDALVDGDAPISGDGLADGDVAACAIANVPNPLPNPRLTAITVFVIQPRVHPSCCIA